MSNKSFLVSVIIPVHNEEKSIPLLLKRLIPILRTYDYEIILIDDGSTDDTLKLLRTQAQNDTHLKVFSFTRNFGHQNALACGYHYATGDCVITIDADLQDPPEIITEMIAKWQDGAQIVYAKRKKRKDNLFKTITAHLFYRFINFLSDSPIPTDVGDFRLQDKTVTTFLKKLPEHNKFLRGLVAWGGFKEAYVEFDRDQRHAGETHYTLSKMLNFAFDGITSFSTKPLRIATYIGFLSSILGIIGIVYAIYRRFFLPHEYWVEGWTLMFVAVTFIGGVQLVTIGIIGEYIGKIYKEVQNRPQYLLKETINS